MKKSTSRIEAEKALAADVYRERAAINRKAQTVLLSEESDGSRQITIRMGNDELALARQQAEARGLRYQTAAARSARAQPRDAIKPAPRMFSRRRPL